jgi:hypothetical protein
MAKRAWPAAALLLLAGLLFLLLRSRAEDTAAAPQPGADAQAREGSAAHAALALQNMPAADPTAAPPSATSSPTVAARRALRERADTIRKQLAERRARSAATGAATSAPDHAVPARAAAQPPAPPPSSEAEGKRRREYLQRAMREQYSPVARSCYEELLGRDPKAAGKVVLFFSIVGDADAGVVEDVELRDGTTFDDPEFTTCMRESLYSTVFEAPPKGSERTTVQFPVELRPGD